MHPPKWLILRSSDSRNGRFSPAPNPFQQPAKGGGECPARVHAVLCTLHGPSKLGEAEEQAKSRRTGCVCESSLATT